MNNLNYIAIKLKLKQTPHPPLPTPTGQKEIYPISPNGPQRCKGPAQDCLQTQGWGSGMPWNSRKYDYTMNCLNGPVYICMCVCVCVCFLCIQGLSPCFLVFWQYLLEKYILRTTKKFISSAATISIVLQNLKNPILTK